MSAIAKKIPKATGLEKPTNKPVRKRWTVHVNVAGHYKDAKAETHISAERLRLAAMQSQPLPYRKELEAQFDADLSGIRVFQGPEVDAALDAEDAVAGVQGEAVLLPANADKPIVAHEVAHILQQRANGPHTQGEAAEIEALQAEALVAANHPVPDVSASLYPGAVAFRRLGEIEETQILIPSDGEASQEFRLAAVDASAQSPDPTDRETGTETEEVLSPAEGSGGASVMEAVDLGEPIPDEPVPTFEPAAMPEIEVDEADAEAAKAEAEAALEGAEDADGLMNAFKDAPPSIKAMHHDQIDGKVGDMAVEDQAAFEANLPEFQAEMSGTDDLAHPEPIQTPEAREAQLEDGTPAPPPEPEVDPTPDPGHADLNATGNSLVSNWFTEGDAAGLGRAFNNISTDDNEVETSAGERPRVPLEGASDPQRIADQDEAARTDAISNRQEATQAVLEGPGPEQVALREIHEEFAMEAREMPQIDQADAPVEGAAGFRDKGLDGEVVALFDAHHQESMASSMEAATAEVGLAVENRNTERDAKVAETEAEKDRLNAEADEAQRAEVGKRRQEVQDARQTAVDAQAQHVSDVETEADIQRAAAQTEIDTQISTTETQIETDFNQAETDAEAEVTAGERQAEEERRKQEREAENLSWWERAANWVADQFDKLTKFINDVFDAVRSAVSAIIDAVKEAALALIDLAASAIIAAIEALGEALKAAVNALLAEHFPAVAAALTDAIDSAVEAATEAVNTVAEGLKAAVAFLLDALAAGLDAILAAYQAAVNAALAIARAALTGDWGALAKLILEPVLVALGIQPAAFYAVIARAVEALHIIIDDPIGFLSNLVEAFVGGVRQFGTNFLTHLQAGIISWLTGALGGDIQIPAKFDLAGVLDLARQILGLTIDMIRRVAVRVLGEEAVERIEFFMGYVVELIRGGFSALWDRIMADLANLKDMVLEAIRSFLVERVIMAAISWLAGLFSPVGALVKLVMTIWNFIMFLKDQLARIIQVVQTIVSTMWEIATGVLQPAIQGVENVLGRLLPIAIDLLARLLGLGNVAGKVKEIINNVRERIENAIVNLINRVLSAFTGGRLGGGTGTDTDATAAADGQIMAPVALSGGGESHMLSIEDQGETVVPMIRSTPMTLETWLDGRMGAPLTELARENAWEGEVLAVKRTELQGLVDRAKTEEGILDREAEQAEDALNADPTQAQDDIAEVADQATDTKRAIEAILDFFGVASDLNLAEKFAEDIARLDPPLAARLRTTVLNRLDARLYSTISWAEARDMIPHDSAIPNTWSEPASAAAVLRSLYNQDFRTGVKRIAEAKVGPRENFEPESQGMDSFLANYLVTDLNQPVNAQRIIGLLLRNAGGGGVASGMSRTIEDAASKAFADQLEWDFTFNEVTGSYYKNTLVPNADGVLGNSNFGPYIEDDVENTAGIGGVPQPLVFFLRDGQSKRASKNRTRLANSVRGADPGHHEWIPSRLASQALAGAAREVETTGNTEALKGATEILEFQHKVRTPTADLIFRPGGPFPASEQTVVYQAKPHRDSEEYADTPASELPQALRDEWYPANAPRQGDRVGVLQGHPGAVYAYVHGGAHSSGITQQVVGHSEWDTALEGKVTEKIDDVVYFRDIREMGANILDFYAETVWRGERDPSASGGIPFPLYFRSRSESDAIRYNQLRSQFGAEFGSIYLTLEAQIRDVTNR